MEDLINEPHIRRLKTVIDGRTVHVVRVIGEPGVATLGRLHSDFFEVERDAGDVVLDLTELGMIDGELIVTLRAAYYRLRRHERRYSVVCPDPLMVELLALVGLRSLVPFYGTVPEAIDAFGDSASPAA